MGLRNRTSQPFWRVTPLASTEPSELYQHGLQCVANRDGKGMLSTGWALCQVAGLHEHQAGDFLTDGYRVWRESPGFDRGQAVAFLTDLFGALSSITPPSHPSDIWSAPSEAVMPASVYYGTRCWAGNELLEVATDPELKRHYEPLVFRAAVDAPHDFVPTRSVEFAKDYATRHGLPEPWVITLPGQREVAHAAAGSPVVADGDANAPTSYASPSDPSERRDPPRPSPTPSPGEAVRAPRTGDPSVASDDSASDTAYAALSKRPLPTPSRDDTDSFDSDSLDTGSFDVVHPEGSGSDAAAARDRPRRRSRPTPGPLGRSRIRRPASSGGAPASAAAPPAAPAGAGPTAAGIEQATWSVTPEVPAGVAQPRAEAPIAPTEQVAAPDQQPESREAAPEQPGTQLLQQQPEPQQPEAQQPGPQQPEAQTAVPYRPDQPQPKPELSAPPRLTDLRSHILSWLRESYRDVRVEPNGWITVPDIGPSVIQIETSIIQGGHLKAEVFAPLVLDVPQSPELFRHVALEGGRFHFGVMSVDADEQGDALVQFSHSLLADGLRRDELLAVVWLVAATIVENAPELQRRFGGSLYSDLSD